MKKREECEYFGLPGNEENQKKRRDQGEQRWSELEASSGRVPGRLPWGTRIQGSLCLCVVFSSLSLLICIFKFLFIYLF